MFGLTKGFYIKVEKSNIPVTFVEYVSEDNIGYTMVKKNAKRYSSKDDIKLKSDLEEVKKSLYGRGILLVL